jgi:hypothetical protein
MHYIYGIMHFFMSVQKLLREQLNQKIPYFHGSKSPIPFEKFEPQSIGTGIVSSGQKYGGFFFTSQFENAEYYTEWFVVEVSIKNIEPSPIAQKNPPQNMKQAVQDKKIYLISDYLDGAVHSDIVIVPASLINDVTITNWTFVGHEESYFEYMDKYFTMGNDEEDEDYGITQDYISSIMAMTGGGLDYALQVPMFRKYFESKE